MNGSRARESVRTAWWLAAHLVLLSLATPSSGDAQVAGGVRIGANISNLSVTENGGPTEIPYESRTGLAFGATAGIVVSPWVTLHVEGRYAQQGSQQRDGGLTAVLRLSYVEVPLVARVSIPVNGSPLTPHLYAGGFTRFETACDVQISGPVSLVLDCDAANLGHHYTTDYGIAFGGGADLRLGPGAMTLDVEYAQGLRNLSGEPGFEAFSKVFGVAAGYRLIL